MTTIHYTSVHLRSVTQPDNWEKISRTLVGRKNKIRQKRCPPPDAELVVDAGADAGGCGGGEGEEWSDDDEEEEEEEEHFYLDDFDYDGECDHCSSRNHPFSGEYNYYALGFVLDIGEVRPHTI